MTRQKKNVIENPLKFVRRKFLLDAIDTKNCETVIFDVVVSLLRPHIIRALANQARRNERQKSLTLRDVGESNDLIRNRNASNCSDTFN